MGHKKEEKRFQFGSKTWLLEMQKCSRGYPNGSVTGEVSAQRMLDSCSPS
jgi:hypothetical protein